MACSRGSRAAAAVAAALAAATVATFAGVVGLGFVYDDFHYLHENPIVSGGLSWQGIRAAFTGAHSANWHPLTWISHQIDVRLFGLAPAGHHLVNLLLHTANVVLLFGLLRALTGALWRPAAVAALFALHPLRVESVAWVAERKDVLSAFFGLLALHAHVGYARAPGVRRAASVAVLLGLGLLSKPMLVTLPFVMLLLDWWPLGRAGGPAGDSPVRLLAEKAPLLALSAAASLATLVAQSGANAVIARETFPFTVRLGHAAISCVQYLARFAWPAGLAVHYPFPAEGISPARAAASLALLLALTWLAFRLRRVAPWLVTGWLWYLGMLVPVIGLVQVGTQATADRYTYLPQVGVAVALCWTGALAARRTAARRALAAAFLIALAGLGAAARAQLPHWKDNLSLFRHALEVTGPSLVAHNNVGLELLGTGRPDEAERHFRAALAILPSYPLANYNLGLVLAARGEAREAGRHFAVALLGDPDYTKARLALADVLLGEERVDDGIGQLREAVRRDPGSREAGMMLAEALTAAGRLAEAEGAYAALIARRPDDAVARLNRGVALSALGREAEGEAEIRTALRLDPSNALAHRNLGSLLDGRGRTAEALAHYREALRLAPGDAATRARVEALLAPRGDRGRER